MTSTISLDSTTVENRSAGLREALSSVASALCDDAPDARASLEGLIADLESPIRIAIGGRIKAGKSTLANALIGRHVAATDVGECTKVVAWYRYRSQERVIVTLRSGEERSLALQTDGSVPVDLGSPADEIDHITVGLSSRERLGRLSYVDTPGLLSANRSYSDAATSALLDPDSRRAIGMADALVYLMPHPSDADRDFLAAFSAQFPGSALSARNVVGVLSKVEKLAERPGVDDPWPSAERIAARYGRDLRFSLRAMLPISGLLAETGTGARFTEADFTALDCLARASAHSRDDMLGSIAALLEWDLADVDRPSRVRLVERLDLYGIRLALELLDRGVRNAPTLMVELRAASRVDALERIIDVELRPDGEVARASRALRELRRTAHGSDDLDGPARRRILNMLERIELDHAALLHRVKESEVLRALDLGEVRFSLEDESRLLPLLREVEVTARLQLSVDAGVAEIQLAAAAEAAHWRRMESDDRSARAQRWAAEVARVSVEHCVSSRSGTSCDPGRLA